MLTSFTNNTDINDTGFSTDRGETWVRLENAVLVCTTLQMRYLVKNCCAIKDSFLDFLAIRSLNCNLMTSDCSQSEQKHSLTERSSCCFGLHVFFFSPPFKPGHCCLQIHHHFTQRQTKPKSDSKQRINSDTIFSICSTRPVCKFLNDREEGGWQVLQWPLEWPCSVTVHILPVFLLPGVTESLHPSALSESTVRIHETNHSSASWKQHLTAVVAMGVLPCDHPQQGWGGVLGK